MELNTTIYRDGEGILVVLVHAFPIDHHLWDDCAAELIVRANAAGLPRFPIWAPDMPRRRRRPDPHSRTDRGRRAGRRLHRGARPHGRRLCGSHPQGRLHQGHLGGPVDGRLSGAGTSSACTRRRWRAWPCATRRPTPTPRPPAPIACASPTSAQPSTRSTPVMHFAEPQPGDSTIKRAPPLHPPVH